MAFAQPGHPRGGRRLAGIDYARAGILRRGPSGKARSKRVLAIERLEPLLMLAADLGHDHGHDGLHVYDAVDVGTIDASTALSGNGGNAPVGRSQGGIPLLNSLAGAAQSLYLDFDGHFDAVWGGYRNVATPVFDKDGNPADFSASEVATIQEIWARVAEDYAPFRINVTTADPGDFSNGKALRLAIGGDGDWIGPYGGVAYVNAFTNSIVNTAYVFSENLGNGHAKYVAEAASHEGGHAFGLEHQSSYNSRGRRTAEYNPGNAYWAPIMGVGYYAERSTWHNGQTTSASRYQDDMAVLSRSANQFGYRVDDVGDTSASALPVVVVDSQISASGIISKMTDVDYFSFDTDGGEVSVALNVASVGANLDSLLELRNAAGQLLASANPNNSLASSISTSLAAGQYFLVARGTGVYGSVGQYSITGTVPPASGGGGGGGGSLPSLSITDVSLPEGDSSVRVAYFTVRLSAASNSTVTVQYSTANGTASSSSDYYATSKTLTFVPGQTSLRVGVYVRGDTLVEADETFFINMRNASGATISDSQGRATIENDDGGAGSLGPTFGQSLRGGDGGEGALHRAGGNEPRAARSDSSAVDRLFTLLGEGERKVSGTLRASRAVVAADWAGDRADRALAAPRLDGAAAGVEAPHGAFGTFGLNLTGGNTAGGAGQPAAFDWLADLSLSADQLRSLVEA